MPIAVHSSIKSKLLSVTHEESEAIWVSVMFGEVRRIFCCFYIPPSFRPEDYQRFCKTTERVADGCGDCSILIAGDFNIPKLTWCNDSPGVLTGGAVGPA